MQDAALSGVSRGPGSATGVSRPGLNEGRNDGRTVQQPVRAPLPVSSASTAVLTSGAPTGLIPTPVATPTDEIDIFAYLVALWRGKYIVLGLVAAAIVTALAVNRFIPPTFEATGLYMVSGAAAADQYALGGLETYRQIATSPQVLAEAAKALGQANGSADGIDTAISSDGDNAIRHASDHAVNNASDPGIGHATNHAISSAVTAEVLKDASVLKVNIRADSPTTAAALAQAWQKAFFDRIYALTLANIGMQIQTQREYVAGMEQSLNTFGAAQTVSVAPSAPSVPSTPSASAAPSARSAGSAPAQTSQEPASPQTVVQFTNGTGDLATAVGTLRRLEKIYAALSDRSLDLITVVSAPLVADTPVAPRKLLNVAIAAMLAAMLGVMIVFLLEGYRSWKDTHVTSGVAHQRP